MRKFTSWMFLSICLIILIGANVSAQDFGQLLEAVDKLEASLKGLVESESDQRQAAISGLHSELQALKDVTNLQSSAGSGNTEEVAVLKLGVDRLAEENQALRAELADQAELLNQIQIQLENAKSLTSGGQDCAEQLAQITGQLIELKSQIHSMQSEQSSDNAVPGPVSVNIPHEAVEEVVGGLDICGFFDVISSYSNSSDDEADFAINQAEVDFENQLSDNILAAAAIAWNGDDGVFELAVAALEMGVYNNEETFVSSLGFTAGQFDVPFGIDFNEYASPDNRFITGPLVVEHSHAGWNDFGLQFNMDTKVGNLTIFGVNGFESSAEVLDEVESLALGEEVFEEVDTTPAFAIGTRLGFTPLSFLEIGTSYSTGWNADNKSEMMLWGTDLQFNMFDFELKGSYILHSVNRSIAEENNRGYYMTGTYSFLDRFFVTSRYGSFKAEGMDWHGQYSFGAGYALIEGVELRMQTLIDEDSDNNTTMFQLVAGF